MLKVICVLIVLTGASYSFANDISEAQDDKSVSWYLSLGQVNFDSPVALQEGVEDDAFYWKLGAEYQENNFIIGGGLSSFSYSDNESFSQEVEDAFGDRSTEDSSANAYNLYVEGGYQFEFGPGFSLAILAGIELVLSSERSIDFCSDCNEEDIDLESGLYLAPRIAYQFSNNIFVSGTYQQHIQGDVENSVFLSIGYLYDI